MSGLSGSVVGGFVPESHAPRRTTSTAPIRTDLLNTCAPESVNTRILTVLCLTGLQLAGIPVAEIKDLPGFHRV